MTTKGEDLSAGLFMAWIQRAKLTQNLLREVQVHPYTLWSLLTRDGVTFDATDQTIWGVKIQFFTDGSYDIDSAKPVRGVYANGETVELGWFTNEALLEALGERIG